MRDEDPIKLILRDISMEIIENDMIEFEKSIIKFN